MSKTSDRVPFYHSRKWEWDTQGIRIPILQTVDIIHQLWQIPVSWTVAVFELNWWVLLWFYKYSYHNQELSDAIPLLHCQVNISSAFQQLKTFEIYGCQHLTWYPSHMMNTWHGIQATCQSVIYYAKMNQIVIQFTKKTFFFSFLVKVQ